MQWKIHPRETFTYLYEDKIYYNESEGKQRKRDCIFLTIH